MKIICHHSRKLQFFKAGRAIIYYNNNKILSILAARKRREMLKLNPAMNSQMQSHNIEQCNKNG